MMRDFRKNDTDEIHEESHEKATPPRKKVSIASKIPVISIFYNLFVVLPEIERERKKLLRRAREINERKRLLLDEGRELQEELRQRILIERQKLEELRSSQQTSERLPETAKPNLERFGYAFSADSHQRNSAFFKPSVDSNPVMVQEVRKKRRTLKEKIAAENQDLQAEFIEQEKITDELELALVGLLEDQEVFLKEQQREERLGYA